MKLPEAKELEEKRVRLVDAATAVATAWQRQYRERLAKTELVRATALYLRQAASRAGAQTGEHFVGAFGHVIRGHMQTLDDLALALYNAGVESSSRPGRPPGARQRPLLPDEQAAVRDIGHALASQFADLEWALS